MQMIADLADRIHVLDYGRTVLAAYLGTGPLLASG